MADPASDLTAANDGADRLAGTLGELSALSRIFGAALTSAFKGAVLQGRELESVLRAIATQISSSALDRALAPVTSSVSSGLQSMLSAALKPAAGYRLGGVFGDGRVMPFASGGVISRPSYFPLAGGRTGLMGEAGAEAIMPLKRGPDGRLGVAAERGQQVNVTMNIATPDVEGFRKAEAQLQAKLARAVGRGRRGL